MILAQSLSLAALVLVAALGVIVLRQRAASPSVDRYGAASHDLRTPIAGVRALLQSLQLGSIPEDARREFLARGVGECDRLARHIEALLDERRRCEQTASLRPCAVTTSPFRKESKMQPKSAVLASEGNVAIRRCCNEHLVLACGPMTLTLDEEGLRLMARVLDDAVNTLDAMKRPMEALDA